MGITAENVAARYEIAREAQDALAMQSQERALQAIADGRFTDEIVPVTLTDRRGHTTQFAEDEYPNRTTSREKLAALRPAFKKEGTVTAGNASGINDGAAVLLIASEEALEKYGLTPLAEIVSVGQGGVEPEVMGLGPVQGIANVFSKVTVSMQDIELFELNEAFAAQAIGVMRELQHKYGVSEEWLTSRVNVNGGAIALGHPIGASGARIVTTLAHEMKKRSIRYGLASLCIGGGMGTAVLIKSV